MSLLSKTPASEAARARPVPFSYAFTIRCKTSKEVDMILYHATYGIYIDIIKEEGLLSRADGNESDNWGWGAEYTDEIFLSDDKDVAASYCESAEHVDEKVLDSGIYIVEVDVDEENVEEDPWVSSASSYVHHGEIGPDRFVRIERYEG